MIKFKKILLILLIFLSLTTVVYAKTYNFPEKNISITLNDNYIDMFSQYYDNEEKLANVLSKDYYEQYVQINKSQGTLLDAIELDENGETITEVVVGISNLTTDSIVKDLKQYNEEQLNKYKESFISGLKKQLEDVESEIKEDEIFVANNGDVYVKLHANIYKQESYVFYTIKNYQLIGINIRYPNGNADIEKAKEIVNNVYIQDIADDNYNNYIIQIIGYSIFCLLVIIIAIIKKRKYKNGLNITKEEKEKYSKFGGFLIFFVVVFVLNIVTLIISTITYALQSKLVVYATETIRCITNLILLILILKNIFIRSIDTPWKIKKYIYIMLCSNIIMAIAGIAYALLDSSNLYRQPYYISQILNLIASISRTVIFITYFKVSKRANVYYRLKNT